MDAKLAFAKMQENETLKKEVNPFDDNDKEKRPFYRGFLIYEDGKEVEYFRLLNLGRFICRVFTPSNIAMRTFSSSTTFHIMNLDDWLGTVNNELSYTREEKWRYTGYLTKLKVTK